MPRGCSDSDSEEERHDRFKSERNKTSVPSLRANIPTYLGRSRSPLRPDNLKVSRHRSRYSEERRRVHTPPRRVLSRDRKSPRENEKRSSSQEYKDKHRRKRSHEKNREECESKKRSKELDEKHVEKKDSREKEHKHRSHKDKKRSSKEKDRKVDCIRRRKSRDETLDSQSSGKHSSQDKSSSEKSRDSDSSVNAKSDDENGLVSDIESQPLPRYYEIVDECAIDSDQKHHSDDKNSKKHKKIRDRSENHHDNKKKKKEKKHKRKHEKRKSEGDSDSKIVENKITNEATQLSPAPSSLEPTNETEDIIEIDDVMEEENKENEVAKEECNILKKSSSEHEEGEISGSESEQYFGPALPPGKNAERKYGPMLPSDVDHYGPALPPSLPPTEEKEEDDEPEGDVIGPLPAGIQSSAQSALDARASLIKYQMENKTDEDAVPKREAWMTELPEAKRAVLGLGPRKFRANAAPDMTDRSSWTDTPEDKAKKQLTGETEDPPDLDSKKLEIIERNKEMELLAKKSEKKSKSLLQMHQKDLKKKKKKKDKDKTPERRPFNREIDLQTNRFDEAQKRSIIKKAQLLDTRFSSGESKFL